MKAIWKSVYQCDGEVRAARPANFRVSTMTLLACAGLLSLAACHHDVDPQRVSPRQLRDVPAKRLAYSFHPDIEPPQIANPDDATARLQGIQNDFETRRKDEALLHIVASPDGQRALALYGVADEPSQNFHIDLYSADGQFLRNLSPPDLDGVFPNSVVWSSDSSFIAFVGRKSLKAQPSPTPIEAEPLPLPPSESPLPTPSVGPAFAPLRVFNTEQVYLCNRDGYDLKPLTTRDGLIYFALSWAPDNHALAALACKEGEWTARENEFKTPAGRPRLISLDGHERLLDDSLAEAPPVWSPDSSKVATAFGVDIGVYDAASKAPTQARIPLREPLLVASSAFDYEKANSRNGPAKGPVKTGGPAPPAAPLDSTPVSFNPIVRLEWQADEKLYFETAYVSVRSELVKTFSRWHLVELSPQTAALGR